MILPVLIPSAFALPANEVYFLLGHHFTLTHNTSCERTDLTSTMFCHWTSSLWWFLGLPLPFDAYVLVSWLWVKDQIIAYIVRGGGGEGRGVVNDVLFTYTTYNITKKGFFHLLWWKFTSCLLCQILLSDFWNFYTKPIILMSWYYLSAQISEAAPLPPVFCKFQ